MRLLTYTVYSTCILFSFFLFSCQAEHLNVSEILNKSKEAISEVESIEYETIVIQNIINPLYDDITYENVITGKFIKDPFTSEIISKSTAAEQEIEIKNYYFGNMIYYYDPGSGWMWEELDIEDNSSIDFEYEDLFYSINILLELGIDEVLIEEKNEEFIVTYQGNNPEIANYYKNEFLDDLNRITKDLDTMLVAAGSIDYSDFNYSLSIDKESYLPKVYSISYRFKVKLLDEDFFVDYKNITRYLQYNSITTEHIVIPDEVIILAEEKVEEGTIDFEGGVYVGELQNGIPHGQGVYTFPEGHIYVGEFKNGFFYGHGELSFNDNKYVGEFKDDLFHGRGILYFADGDKLECDWEEGEPHGQGVLTKVDGSVQSGRWVRGNYVGE